MTPRPPSTSLTCATLLLVTTALTGCTVDPAPAPSPSPTTASSPLPVADLDREALEGMLAEMQDTLTALRTELEAAATGDQAALAAAAELLVADVDTVTEAPPQADGAATDDGQADSGDDATSDDAAVSDGDGTGDVDTRPPTVDLEEPAPVLPGPLSSRAESFQYGDLLTRTLAAARGAGSAGEQVQRFLADPLAGDLGAWQRAPDDQLAAIARAGTTGDLAATERAVLDLDGEASRALAWVVHGLSVPSDATDAAGRALAHLAVIDIALDQLT